MNLTRIIKNGAITGSVGAVTATLMGASYETLAFVTTVTALAPATIEGSIDLGKWSINQWGKKKEKIKTFSNDYLNPINPSRNVDLTVGAIFAAGGAVSADVYEQQQKANYGSLPFGSSATTFKTTTIATAFTFGVLATQAVKRAWNASTGYLAAQAKKAHDALAAKNLDDAKRKADDAAQAATNASTKGITKEESEELKRRAEQAAAELTELQKSSSDAIAAATGSSSDSSTARSILAATGLTFKKFNRGSSKAEDKDKDNAKNTSAPKKNAKAQ